MEKLTSAQAAEGGSTTTSAQAAAGGSTTTSAQAAAGGSTRTMAGLRALAEQALYQSDPTSKVALTQQAWAIIEVDAEGLHDLKTPASSEAPGQNSSELRSVHSPGRPARPQLVAPKLLSPRKLSSAEGRAALVHAVAHIEFNAINLAWDAVYRFAGMPGAYYRDWASVAFDEARHFVLLEKRLQELGFCYGDFLAHDGLWEMAVKTADNLTHRMALVPRLLEARGLDVTPGMIAKLKQAGDWSTVSILELILREEVRHVEIGSRWFNYLCELASLNPESTFAEILRTLAPQQLRLPFNVEARLRAGFSETELQALQRIAEAAQ